MFFLGIVYNILSLSYLCCLLDTNLTSLQSYSVVQHILSQQVVSERTCPKTTSAKPHFQKMASTSDTNVEIRKFDGKNFALWKVMIQDVLIIPEHQIEVIRHNNKCRMVFGLLGRSQRYILTRQWGGLHNSRYRRSPHSIAEWQCYHLPLIERIFPYGRWWYRMYWASLSMKSRW